LFALELPKPHGGFPVQKNGFLAPLPEGAIGGTTYGDEGDRNRGEIHFEITLQNLAHLNFFYSGYPNGKSLRFELRSADGKSVVCDLTPAKEEWLSFPIQIPDTWNSPEKNFLVAIDESDAFAGWIGLAVATPPTLFSKFFGEWRHVLGILLVVLVGVGICGPALLYRGAPFLRVPLAMLMMGVWSLAAFYLALITSGAWFRLVFFLAVGAGLMSWVIVFLQKKNKMPGSGIHAPQASMLIVMMGCLLLPVLVAGLAQSTDLFSWAQNKYAFLPMDNRIPWILAQAVIKDSYSSPLFSDWLGSDRPPLQAGLIILMEPVLSWLAPVDGAFSTSVAAQGFWILGAIVLLRSLGASDPVIRCALVTASVSGCILLNGIFTWPKLLSGGYLFAAAGLLFAGDQKGTGLRRDDSRIAVAGLLAGLAMQAHGSSAFAILPLGVVFFRKNMEKDRIHFQTKKIIIFVISFFALQAPWAIWQKVGDPPGNRLIKWHLGGAVPIDQRNAMTTIIESYKSVNLKTFLNNKAENLRTLWKPVNFPATPWLSLENRQRARNADFFGLFPAMSWALPGWMFLAFLFLFGSSVRAKIKKCWCKGAPVLGWMLGTVAVWVLLMFIPGSTVNHQGPMNLALLGLLLSGAALGFISAPGWMFATFLQGAGVFFVYWGIADRTQGHASWLFATLMVFFILLFLCARPRIFYSNKSMYKTQGVTLAD